MEPPITLYIVYLRHFHQGGIHLANLEQKFNIAGDIDNHQKSGILHVLEKMEGINQASVNIGEKSVTVGYTPGIINIQQVKEAIESQGVDVSDQGDD